MLGTKDTTTIENASFVSYSIGDYYINEPAGFIYKVIEKTNDTTCTFEYQATIQQPLPNITTSPISPYVEGETGYEPKAPRVEKTLLSDGWQLDFKLPEAPKPAVSSSFVGSAEEGSVTSKITSEDTVTFTFKIPTGSKLFAGLEITANGATTSIEGARLGDVYLNSETGVIYTLTETGWKASEKSIKGPVGDALDIEVAYQLTETETYAASLENGVSYIEANYAGDIDPSKVFAITWTLKDNGGDISYWYYKTNAGAWDRAQLTGGVASLIVKKYTSNADNKAYSVNYVNSLIGSESEVEEELNRIAYSKKQVNNLISWGSFTDLLKV